MQPEQELLDQTSQTHQGTPLWAEVLHFVCLWDSHLRDTQRQECLEDLQEEVVDSLEGQEEIHLKELLKEEVINLVTDW